MARIRAKKSTAQPTTTGTSITVALPTHVAGDVLVICLGRDNNRENFAAPTGWTQAATVGFGTTSATSNAVRGALSWDDLQFVEKMAPASIQLPRGYRMKIEYEPGKPPRGRASALILSCHRRAWRSTPIRDRSLI